MVQDKTTNWRAAFEREVQRCAVLAAEVARLRREAEAVKAQKPIGGQAA